MVGSAAAAVEVDDGVGSTGLAAGEAVVVDVVSETAVAAGVGSGGENAESPLALFS